MTWGANLVTLLESEARTATTNSGEINNTLYNSSVYVIVDVTEDPSTASVTPKLQLFDEASDGWVDVWEADSAVDATGTSVFIFGPGVVGSETGSTSNSGDVAEIMGMPLPGKWRWRMEHADGESITYSVGLHVIP